MKLSFLKRRSLIKKIIFLWYQLYICRQIVSEQIRSRRQVYSNTKVHTNRTNEPHSGQVTKGNDKKSPDPNRKPAKGQSTNKENVHTHKKHLTYERNVNKKRKKKHEKTHVMTSVPTQNTFMTTKRKRSRQPANPIKYENCQSAVHGTLPSRNGTKLPC
jgi:hypothetical protein